MPRQILFHLFAIALIGCGDAAGPRDASVNARLESTGLAVTNNTDARIHVFTVERARAAQINWVAGCPTPAGGIGRRETIRIPYDELFGWGEHSSEVLVYWWCCVVTIEGRLTPGEIEYVIATR